MAGPAPPAGFDLEAPSPPPRRRSPSVANAPPEGFELEATGEAHDGDTFALSNGHNARLGGVDAFELNQTGRTTSGQPVRLGDMARTNLVRHINPQSRVTATGEATYGRPVVNATTGGADVGRTQVSAGLAIPTPQYLKNDPTRLGDYVAAQRDAIADERGAYAGTYQMPGDFRHQGASAPMVGKIPMSPEDRRAYGALVRNPKTKPADLDAFGLKLGRRFSNSAELLSFYRKNPTAPTPLYWYQTDVRGDPVQPTGQNVVTRHMGALNEGIADVVGAPVDLVNSGLTFAGLPMSRKPIMGSDWVRDQMHALGIGQVDVSYAPRSNAERYTQAAARGTGQAVVPIGGTLSVGGRLAARAPSLLTEGSAVRSAVRNSLVDAAKAPAIAIAGEVGGGVGANVAGEGANDVFPGNIYAQVIAQTLGALGGGLGAAGAVSRFNPAVRPVTTLRNVSGGDLPSAPPMVPQRLPAGQIEALPTVPRVAAMDSGIETPTLTGPAVRQPDRIDTGWIEPPPGYTLETPIGGGAGNIERPTPTNLANAARGINPEDVTPIPANAPESSAELEALAEGVRTRVQAPDERSFLTSRSVNGRNRRDPLDLIGFLRTRGGVRDEGGELSAMGVGNKSRDLDFARGEGFLGSAVTPKGMSLDDAAHAAWEAGYFPDRAEPPTVPEFLDALDATNRGDGGRVFHPDDWSSIDDYYNAQDQRFAVARAEQEGSPLAHDQGRPVGPDDLDANQPPVTAYEDLPRVGGKVSNLNLAHLESDADIRRVLQTTEKAVGSFDASRRGRMSQGETEALASEMGMTPDDLLKRRRGQALNAEEALAARQLLAKSADELIALATKVRDSAAVVGEEGTASPEALLAFRQAWLRHAAIQEQVTGATAEAGRALAQFKIAAKSDAVSRRIHANLIRDAGGPKKLEEVAEAILDLQKQDVPPGAVNKFALKALNPKWSDKLVELWYNSLLSGPQTHAVNVLSNTITAGLQIPEHIAASAIGQFRRNSVDRVMGSEIAPRIVGQLQGTKEGFRAFWRTLKTGEVPDFVTKVESASQKAISGVKGSIIRTPSRFLAAEDELFKAVARRSEIAGMAVRKARKEGLKGDALYKRIDELTQNPTDDMIDGALDYARYVTYQRPLGKLGQGISSITQNHPVLKLFLPFVRTPSNIFKFVAERSPAAPILKEWRADVKAGGARRDLAVARMTLGTGFGMMVAEWAKQGIITGSGPLDENASRVMRSDGWQPYSIRIGDKYYSYQRLDPIASTLGVAADLALRSEYMTDKQTDEAAMLVTASILKNLGDKTWLSGVSDVVKAVDDPERYSEALVKRLAGSIAVPAFVAQAARTIDPVARRTEGSLDAIKARIPGLSDDLYPQRDVWGQEIRNEGGVGPDFMSPIWTKTAHNDPLATEMLNAGASIGQIPRKDMSAADYDALTQLAGTMLETQLRQLIASPVWAHMSPDDRAAEVDRIKGEVRRKAKETLFGDLKAKQAPSIPPGYNMPADVASRVLPTLPPPAKAPPPPPPGFQ